jgi:hypothetical protein
MSVISERVGNLYGMCRLAGSGNKEKRKSSLKGRKEGRKEGRKKDKREHAVGGLVFFHLRWP